MTSACHLPAAVTLVVQPTVLVLVGVAFRLRASVAAVFIGFGFIVLVAIGLASVSYTTGLLVKSEDAFAPLINTIVVQPLLSGIFVPESARRQVGCGVSSGCCQVFSGK